MARNKAYTKFLMEKAILTAEQRGRITHNTTVAVMQAYGIALHNRYGFGRQRLETLEKEVQNILLEWDRMQDDGLDYANYKLQEAYRAAMGLEQTTETDWDEGHGDHAHETALPEIAEVIGLGKDENGGESKE